MHSLVDLFFFQGTDHSSLCILSRTGPKYKDKSEIIVIYKWSFMQIIASFNGYIKVVPAFV